MLERLVFGKDYKKLDSSTTFFLVCSHIGDVYALSGLALELKRVHGIERLGIATVGKLKSVVDMFDGIDEFVPVGKFKADVLTKLHLGSLAKPKKLRVPGINIALPGLFEKLATFGNLNFWDMFLCELGLEPSYGRVVFRTPDKLPEPSPAFVRFTHEEHENAQHGVFVCPSSRAMRMTSALRAFVRELVRRLRISGFSVYLNDCPEYLADIRSELGLKVVHLPLTDIIHVAEFFGRVVVVRSGLADMLAAAKAKMLVLYAPENTQHIFRKRKYIDYFTLAPFQKRGEVLELETVGGNLSQAEEFLSSQSRK